MHLVQILWGEGGGEWGWAHTRSWTDAFFAIATMRAPIHVAIEDLSSLMAEEQNSVGQD